MRFYTVYSWEVLEKQHKPWNVTHIRGKSHHYVERRWARSGQSCFSSVRSVSTSCLSNGLTPIKPCCTRASLWEERGVMRPMWDILNLTPRGLDDGHPELLFWRYVDTNVKDNPSDGWYILRKILSASLASWPPLSSVYWGRYQLYSLLFDNGIS